MLDLTTTQVLNGKLLLGSQFRPNPITVFFFNAEGFVLGLQGTHSTLSLFLRDGQGKGRPWKTGFSAACGIGRMFAHSSLKLVGNEQNQKW